MYAEGEIESSRVQKGGLGFKFRIEEESPNLNQKLG